MFEFEQMEANELKGFSFHALIIAAIRKADTENRETLRNSFPELFNIVQGEETESAILNLKYKNPEY